MGTNRELIGLLSEWKLTLMELTSKKVRTVILEAPTGGA